jgi:hypothetical protein
LDAALAFAFRGPVQMVGYTHYCCVRNAMGRQIPWTVFACNHAQVETTKRLSVPN